MELAGIWLLVSCCQSIIMIIDDAQVSFLKEDF